MFENACHTNSNTLKSFNTSMRRAMSHTNDQIATEIASVLSEIEKNEAWNWIYSAISIFCLIQIQMFKCEPGINIQF